jgi:Flp pilus assembly protein TadG
LPDSHSRIAIRKETGVWRLQSRLKEMARLPTISAGQTLVEFAFILPLVLLLMLGVVQVALIGGSALAVNQAAIACVRYAAVNPSADQSTVNTYLKSIASPLINDSNLQTLTLAPTATPRTTGSAVSVTVVYTLSSKLFLGASFFGITFPTQLSGQMTMTSE